MEFSVSIVSPNPIAREGLSRIIDSDGFHVLSISSSVEDLNFDQLRHLDMIIVDVPTREEQMVAIDYLSQRSSAKVLILAESFDLSSMISCFVQGAHGYVVKNMPCSTLLASLRLAALGHKVMPSDLADRLPREWLLPNESALEPEVSVGDAKLSQRESDVLQCLITGDPNKIIARKLEVSEATVKVHVKAILRKLNVSNRTQAAIWATSRGIGVPALQTA